MAPLQKVIEDVCFQQKPQINVSTCRLYHQKKLLDPTTPVRFANLPKEAKLELVTGVYLQKSNALSLRTLGRAAGRSVGLCTLKGSSVKGSAATLLRLHLLVLMVAIVLYCRSDRAASGPSGQASTNDAITQCCNPIT